jgi:hypothetical protein
MSDYMQGDPDRNSVVVPFSDDETVRDDQLILDDDKPSDSVEERKNRKEKRQARLQGIIQQGKKNAEELEAERKRNVELSERLARLEGAVVATQSQQRQASADGKDEFERELDAIYEEQQNAYRAAQAEVKAGTFDDKRQAHYENIARSIESRKTTVHTRRVLAQTEGQRQQNQAQQVWVQKYPEVYRNNNAFQFAQAKAQQRLALGESITPQVVDEIMAETMTTFKIGARPAPTQSERARLSGMPASGGGGGGGGSGGGITLTPALKQMAIAAYDHLPEADAIKAWTNKTGKRLREKKAL